MAERDIGIPTSSEPPRTTSAFTPAFQAGAAPSRSGTREVIPNPGDERVRVPNARQMPYIGLCLLKAFAYANDGSVRAEVFGTGWFSTPKTVVTAGHNLYNPAVFGEARGGWADAIHIYPAYNGEDPPPYGGFEERRRLYVPTQYHQTQDVRSDIGVVKFDQSIAADNSFLGFEVWNDERLGNSRALIAGYPLDLGGGLLMFEGRDQIKALEDSRLYYELDTGKGQSGAPLLIERDGKPVVVVGVHAHNSSETPTAFYPANSATRITQALAEWVQQHS